MNSQLIKLAETIRRHGGRLLLVGGSVRDEILNIPNKDFDCECFGVQEHKLDNILKTFSQIENLNISFVGKSFGVWKLRNKDGLEFDVALPREEVKTGTGHRGFIVVSNPYLNYVDSAKRRDFTIGAISKDILTSEYIDPFNGRKDLENKVLRMVSPKSFQEDSLRVLRLVQFASRFGFAVEEQTKKFAQQTDLSDLPKERIWMELEKMFLKSPKPSVGINLIMELGIRDKLFPHLCIGKLQEEAMDRVAKFKNVTDGEKLTLMVALMGWGNPTVLEELGVTSVEGYPVKQRAEELLEHAPYKLPEDDYGYHKLSQKLNLFIFGLALRAYGSKYTEMFMETIIRLGIQEKPVEPILKGRHLIEMGLEPSPDFSEILGNIYDKQIRGEVSTLEEAKQAVLYG